MGYPVLDGSPVTNVYSEHVYKIRATFGASSAVTYRSKDATIAKTTTTTFTVTLPQAYAEITSFSYGWYKPAGVEAARVVQITTNSVATDGTLVLTTVDTNTAGTAAAPASGDVLYLTIGVSQDQLNDRFTG
jgi:hypothetical protein